MGFMAPSTDFRFILETDTTVHSPVSEELVSQIRHNLEELFYYDRYTSYSGTLSSDPTATILTDSTKSWSTNGFVGQTVVMMSGTAQGYYATIASNTGTTITCTGSSFVIMGAASGDTFGVFFTRDETTGHTHNGTNSAPAGAINMVYELWQAGGISATGTTVNTATVWTTTDWFMTHRGSETKLMAAMYGASSVSIPRIYLIYDTSTNANYNFTMDSVFTAYQAQAPSSSYAYDVSAWTADAVYRIQTIKIGTDTATATIYGLQLFLN
jgi:hypothetical protein